MLRLPTEEITEIDDKIVRLARRLELAMRAARGLGLAANQLGYSKRMFTYLNEDKRCVVVINPVVLTTDGEVMADEGCLSIPGKKFQVARPKHMALSYTNLDGNEKVAEGSGHVARCFGHEMDHLRGVLLTDYFTTDL